MLNLRRVNEKADWQFKFVRDALDMHIPYEQDLEKEYNSILKTKTQILNVPGNIQAIIDRN